jgi:hypothetical protein
MTKHHRVLKKVVFGMTETSIGNVIKSHEDRGWKRSSQIKKHGYGLGCQMVWDKNK